jgi:hypothetical protein
MHISPIEFGRKKDRKKRKKRNAIIGASVLGGAALGGYLLLNKKKVVPNSKPDITQNLLPANQPQRLLSAAPKYKRASLRKVGMTRSQISQGKWDRLPNEMKVMMIMNNTLSR